MKYLLMHKEIPVVELELDSSCSIAKIGAMQNREHLPPGILMQHGRADRASLNEWWCGRAIPASRDGIRGALEELGLSSTQRLLDKCLGLSLSDQYWIRPAGTSIAWAEVNFFENAFSGDVGNILFGGRVAGNISLMSPDNTSDGWLRKKWKIIEGKRCLLKGGSGATRQEPYNEALASAVMRRLSIPHVPYTITMLDGYPYSVCEDFVTPHTELVSAWYIMRTQKKRSDRSVYQHYLDCCEALGIPGIADALDRMLTVDYLIANEDRHQNNFGVLRNADTLEWLGPAPVYDSGTSLWFDRPTALIQPTGRLQSKPFKTTHDEQIKLVRSFDWLDLNALDGLEEEFREMVRDSVFVDAARCDALCRAIRRRIELLADVIRNRTRVYPGANLEHEVQDDRAYSGSGE